MLGRTLTVCLAIVACLAGGCAAEPPEDEELEASESSITSGPGDDEDEEGADEEPDREELAAQLREEAELQALASAPSVAGDKSLASRVTKALGRGIWGYDVIAVKGKNAPRPIVSARTTRKMWGASTFKLFTGFTALKTRSASKTLIGPQMMVPSNNPNANLVMCRSGEALRKYDAPCVAAQPARSNMRLPEAIAAAKKDLSKRGVTFSPSFAMVDGAGYSAKNWLTPKDLTALLQVANADAEASTFRSLLAKPGTGTLKSRLARYKGRVFAKTGTYVVNQTVALAGYVTLKNGETLVFSVVGNAVGGVPAARGRLDAALAEIIDEVDGSARP